ncbi:LysR family transcriptional regulator [Taklimakanibacter deserti]|uniref:LysR family transcriptional regulator n=1 Tax=Taklimakanibacter deserti TaxID=2267839 RepID=UPI000E656CDF
MQRPSLTQLQTLAEVAGAGSFLAAARKLGLTQPAVSLRIHQLEQALGLRLIERVGRRAQPTTAGATLLGYVKQIDATLDEALRALSRHSASVAGKVRLGTGATACIYLLPPVLRALKTRYPGIEIAVRTGNSGEILEALAANELDVAVVTLPAPGRSFEVKVMIEDEMVAAYPADAAPADRLTPAFFARQPGILLYEPAGNSRLVIDRWFREAGELARPGMELGNIEAIKKMVGAGLGLSIIPEMAVGPGDEGLAVRPLSPRLHRRIGMVLRRDKVPDKALKAVIKALTGLARR